MGDDGDTVYTHGHHPTVLRSHTWRTAENSAAYLLDHLRPGLRLLDVGCGPGNLTLDLAARTAPGASVGLDRSDEVLDSARSAARERGVEVEFREG
ncbi:MAG: methyltransferase domain-containing protein, partial [Actinomycetota bacterium]